MESINNNLAPVIAKLQDLHSSFVRKAEKLQATIALLLEMREAMPVAEERCTIPAAMMRTPDETAHIRAMMEAEQKILPGILEHSGKRPAEPKTPAVKSSREWVLNWVNGRASSFTVEHVLSAAGADGPRLDRVYAGQILRSLAAAGTIKCLVNGNKRHPSVYEPAGAQISPRTVPDEPPGEPANYESRPRARREGISPINPNRVGRPATAELEEEGTER